MDAILNNVFEKILKESEKQTKKIKTQNSLEQILEEDTLRITNENSVANHKSIIEWNQIKDKRYGFDEPIDLWSKGKIFSYLRYRIKCFDVAYKDSIDCSIGLARRHTFIKELFNKIEKLYKQNVNNSMVRDYIEFYVQTILENRIAAKGSFDVYDFYKLEHIRNFLKKIQVHQEINANSDTYEQVNCLSMAEAYESGGVSFLSNAGLVYAYFFLKQNKNLQSTKCIKILQTFLTDAKREGAIAVDKIKEKTKLHGPYAQKYADQELLIFLEKVAQLKVEFIENGKQII